MIAIRKAALALAVPAALGLAACHSEPEGAGGASPEATEATTTVPAEAAPQTPAGAAASASAEPSANVPPAPAPSLPPPVAVSDGIPSPMRGRWGLVPKDCSSTMGDNKGLMTVSARELKFFESVAELGAVKQADADHLRASFDYSGEGMTWKHDVTLDLKDGGKTLVRTDHGPDAQPGPQIYKRCG